MKNLSRAQWVALLILVLWGLALIGCNSASAATNNTVGELQPSHPISHPIASSGCGRAFTQPLGTSANQTIMAGGILRRYRLHLPLGFHNTTPVALVMNFHGHGSTMAQQETRTQFSTFTDHADVLVVYPQGVVGPDHATGWGVGPAWDPNVDDVQFVSDLLDHLQANWCIDPQRIYATGFSNGGGMTNLLACELAGRIAAFASVGGSYPPVPGGCHPRLPVPLLEIHGTADTVVPYGGLPKKHYPAVTDWLQTWVQRDGCATPPHTFWQVGASLGERWDACRGRGTLIHYRIAGMEHLWPTAQIVSANDLDSPFNATSVIWAFFQEHSLPSTLSQTAP